jgi:hypothetical protein
MIARAVRGSLFLPFVALLHFLPGCSRGAPIDFAETVNAGGVRIQARSEIQDDSVRVSVQFTNDLDTTTDLILQGSCPVTIIAHDERGVAWDEREGRTCDPAELAITFAPSEYRLLAHAAARDADPALGPGRESRIAVRVLLAGGREYIVNAAPR